MLGRSGLCTLGSVGVLEGGLDDGWFVVVWIMVFVDDVYLDEEELWLLNHGRYLSIMK